MHDINAKNKKMEKQIPDIKKIQIIMPVFSHKKGYICHFLRFSTPENNFGNCGGKPASEIIPNNLNNRPT